MATISERLKELREIHGIEQAELAKIAGVSRTAMGKYENGEVIPKATSLIAIAKAYSVSVDWLCGLTDVTGGGEIKTVYDIVCLLLTLQNIPSVGCTLSVNCVGAPAIFTMYFRDQTVANAIEESKKMITLYNDGTIDGEVFELWQEKMKRKYSNILLVSDGQSTPDAEF